MSQNHSTQSNSSELMSLNTIPSFQNNSTSHHITQQMQLVKESLDTKSLLYQYLISTECFLVLQKSKDLLSFETEMITSANTSSSSKRHNFLIQELQTHVSQLKNFEHGNSHLLGAYNQRLQKLFSWHMVSEKETLTKIVDTAQHSTKLLPKKRWRTHTATEENSATTTATNIPPTEIVSDDDSNDETYMSSANDFRRAEEIPKQSPASYSKKRIVRKKRRVKTDLSEEEGETTNLTSSTTPTLLDKSASEDDSEDDDESYRSKTEKSKNVLPQIRKINLFATEIFLSYLLPIKLVMWTKPFNNTTIDANIVSVTFDETNTKSSNFLSIIVQYPVDSTIYWASVSGAANEMLIDARGGKLRNSAIKDNRVKNSINGFIDCKILNLEGRKLNLSKKNVPLQPSHVLRLEELFSKEVRTGEERIDWTKLITKTENPQLYHTLLTLKNDLEASLKKLKSSLQGEEEIYSMLQQRRGTKCKQVQPRRGFLTTEERIQLGLKHKNWIAPSNETTSTVSKQEASATTNAEDAKDGEEDEEVEIQILEDDESESQQ